jgi:hypothetical protein
MINKNLIKFAQYITIAIGTCTILYGAFNSNVSDNVNIFSIIIGTIMVLGTLDLMIKVK